MRKKNIISRYQYWKEGLINITRDGILEILRNTAFAGDKLGRETHMKSNFIIFLKYYYYFLLLVVYHDHAFTERDFFLKILVSSQGTTTSLTPSFPRVLTDLYVGLRFPGHISVY